VTIAIIDDGVDIHHGEFGGAGKIVAPRDATLRTDDPTPKDPFGPGPDDGDNHDNYTRSDNRRSDSRGDSDQDSTSRSS
jgi:subtilisin family serine protease